MGKAVYKFVDHEAEDEDVRSCPDDDDDDESTGSLKDFIVDECSDEDSYSQCSSHFRFTREERDLSDDDRLLVLENMGYVDPSANRSKKRRRKRVSALVSSSDEEMENNGATPSLPPGMFPPEEMQKLHDNLVQWHARLEKLLRDMGAETEDGDLLEKQPGRAEIILIPPPTPKQAAAAEKVVAEKEEEQRPAAEKEEQPRPVHPFFSKGYRPQTKAGGTVVFGSSAKKAFAQPAKKDRWGFPDVRKPEGGYFRKHEGLFFRDADGNVFPANGCDEFSEQPSPCP